MSNSAESIFGLHPLVSEQHHYKYKHGFATPSLDVMCNQPTHSSLLNGLRDVNFSALKHVFSSS
jgi:hypothetical protein